MDYKTDGAHSDLVATNDLIFPVNLNHVRGLQHVKVHFEPEVRLEIRKRQMSSCEPETIRPLFYGMCGLAGRSALDLEVRTINAILLYNDGYVVRTKIPSRSSAFYELSCLGALARLCAYARTRLFTTPSRLEVRRLDS